jgi:hypothetical protein
MAWERAARAARIAARHGPRFGQRAAQYSSTQGVWATAIYVACGRPEFNGKTPCAVGALVRECVGAFVGEPVGGDAVGEAVGDAVGESVGELVGARGREWGMVYQYP